MVARGSMFVYWRDPYDDEGPMGSAVYTLDVSGGHERQLTRPSMNAGSASWSPDGRWIVFSTYPLGEYDCREVSNLYRMHPDGSRMEQLTHYRSDDFRATQPRYTPDGEWIVFTGVSASSRSIWVMPADGGEPIDIVPGGILTHPDWQPR